MAMISRLRNGGRAMLTRIETNVLAPRVEPGPVLRQVIETAKGDLDGYRAAGGFETLKAVVERSSETLLGEITEARVRGRAGGGFPTGLKWSLVASRDDAEKALVVNLNSGQPGGIKERWLVNTNPFRVLEASLAAAHCIGAGLVVIYVGRDLEQQEEALKAAAEACQAAGLAGEGGLVEARVVVFRTPGGYISGEETAAARLLEGRPGQPRKKPPMPTRRGLEGRPTATSNVDTLLQVLYVLEHGAEAYRALGTTATPGTLTLAITGAVERPGIYEVEAGTRLRHTIEELAGGGRVGRELGAVFLGGVTGTVIRLDGDVDVELDYEVLMERDLDLGSGVILGVGADQDPVDLAVEVARFFRETSCGQCRPCQDGNKRVHKMLDQLEDLNLPSVDIRDRELAPSPRTSSGLKVINPSASQGGISYTDMTQGLDKISSLAEWYKYRGDCHFSQESARGIQSILKEFEDELEAVIREPSPDAAVSAS